MQQIVKPGSFKTLGRWLFYKLQAWAFSFSLTLFKSLQVRIGINEFISSMLLSHHLNVRSSLIISSSKRLRSTFAGLPATMV